MGYSPLGCKESDITEEAVPKKKKKKSQNTMTPGGGTHLVTETSQRQTQEVLLKEIVIKIPKPICSVSLLCMTQAP